MRSMTTRSLLHDLVPLADRMRYLEGMRLAITACVVAYAMVVSTAGRTAVAPGTVLAVSATYTAVSLLVYGLWSLRRARGQMLFGALLLGDSVFVVWAAHTSGGAASPLRLLLVVQLISVALLASYPTAMKVAMWNSLLLLATYHAQQAELLGPADGAADGQLQPLVVFIALVWLATITTASFAAVNERELRRRKVDLEDLSRMATALEEALDPPSVASVLHDSLVDAYGFGQVAVVGVLSDRAVPLASTRLRATGSVPVGDVGGIVADAWTSRERQLVARLDDADDELLTELLGPAVNVVVIPLYAEGQPVGVVAIEHGLRRGSRIERRVLTMVERFCAHAALALRNASLLERLRHVAAVDELTELGNRRSFDIALSRELARGARLGQPTALVLLDIDHFKRVNDDYGHLIGDDVLRVVARTLATCSRDEDIVARYGGEEFAVIVPRCELADAAAFAERLREAVVAIATVSPLSASFGVAVATNGNTDAVALIRAADEALYDAKDAGRNRVRTAVPVTPKALP